MTHASEIPRGVDAFLRAGPDGTLVVATADSGTIVSLAVATAAPAEALEWPLAASEFKARLRAESPAIVAAALARIHTLGPDGVPGLPRADPLRHNMVGAGWHIRDEERAICGIVEKYSPKDEEGYITLYSSFIQAWKIYEKNRKRLKKPKK